MVELRALAGGLGWGALETYVQSGNLVFEAEGKHADLEAALEAAIADRFGFAIPVIIRSAAQWAALAADPPFPEVRSNILHLCLTTRPPVADAVQAIEARMTLGERIARIGDALWIDFHEGAGKSKLAPAFLDKAAGSSLTARNLNTVRKLAEMLAA